MPDLDFCAGTNFFYPPFNSPRLGKKSKQSDNVCVWSSDVYVTFVILKFFDLSHGSASKHFIFTDCSVLTDSAFSFAFSLLLFSMWFSFLHKVSVAVVDVPKCWLCLCHG